MQGLPRMQRGSGPSQGVRAFIGRRLSRGEYLGLHLTLGLLFSLAALGIFGVVARYVLGENAVTEFDHTVAERVRQDAYASPAMVFTLKLVTTFGSLLVLTALSMAVALLLIIRRRRLLALVWTTAMIGTGLLDAALKQEFQRPRPAWDPPLIFEPTTSFPSGHSMGSMVGYGLLGYLLVPGQVHWWSRVLTVLGLGLLIVAVGLSRIYLGAHWFSDVVGGFSAGAVWLAFCVTGIETVRRRRLRGREAASGAK
jgi:membrane-associated phospholipid phosphatase